MAGKIMSSHIFYIMDVFTERKYAGNQLAVFQRASRLTSAEMQSIAREINFSETTFILSDEPRNGGFDVRIFTPKEDIPFIGHPTIGTAHIIHCYIDQAKSNEIKLNLKVGQILVSFHADDSCWMKQMPPVFGQMYQTGTLADVLGLEHSEIDERSPFKKSQQVYHFSSCH
jgi:trans-2,3-dihydro-3-hydroxyanthranilate isomerase